MSLLNLLYGIFSIIYTIMSLSIPLTVSSSIA
nr:MAG TPA: hypothetical protein [Crassvirales sp.]